MTVGRKHSGSGMRKKPKKTMRIHEVNLLKKRMKMALLAVKLAVDQLTKVILIRQMGVKVILRMDSPERATMEMAPATTVMTKMRTITENLLSEAYGVLLGKPFSNRTIDTETMAQNHLPDLEGSSLNEIDEELVLYSGDADGAERYCRMTWALYRRMDRSDLERRMSAAAVRLTPLDELKKKHKISIHTCSCLRREGFLLLGDVMDRSERDLLKIPQIGEEQVKEITEILEKEHAVLSDEDFEADYVSMSFPETLHEFQENAYDTLLSNYTEEERRELEALTGDEKVDRLNDLIDQKLELCRSLGNHSARRGLLFLGASIGYRGDFSDAGFGLLKGEDGEQPDKTNGYLILALFYDAMKKGQLRPEADQSMLKVCNELAHAIMSWDLLKEAEDPAIHAKAKTENTSAKKR